MYKIKFSKMWDKMNGIDFKSLKLVRCDKSKVSSLSNSMLNNDRLYRGEIDRSFVFRFDECLILVLKDKNNKGFITIRSFDSSKYRFYKNLVGKRVGVKFPNSYDIMSDINYHNEQQRLM